MQPGKWKAGKAAAGVALVIAGSVWAQYASAQQGASFPFSAGSGADPELQLAAMPHSAALPAYAGSTRVTDIQLIPRRGGGELVIALSKPTDASYSMSADGMRLTVFLPDTVTDLGLMDRQRDGILHWGCAPAERAPGCDLFVELDAPSSLAGFRLTRGPDGQGTLRLALANGAPPPGRPLTGIAWAGGLGLDPLLLAMAKDAPQPALALAPAQVDAPRPLPDTQANQIIRQMQAIDTSTCATPDCAAEPVTLFDGDYWKNYALAPLEMVKRPFAMDRDSLIMNAVALSAFGAAYILDEDIRSDVLRDKSSGSQDVADAVEPLGQFWLLAGAGAASYGAGALFGDDRLARAGLLASQAVLLTALPVEATKNGFTRARPLTGKGKSAWFEGGSNHSFLSGHTAYSFAFASAFAHEYADTGWVPIVAYGLAGAVGLSRIHDDKHWTSDVVLSALVGWGVGQLVTELDPFGSQKALGLEPLRNGDAQGLSLNYKF